MHPTELYNFVIEKLNENISQLKMVRNKWHPT